MIPASFLYKDAFRQHWGRDFERAEKLMPDEPVATTEWPRPSILQAARDLFGLALGPQRSRR